MLDTFVDRFSQAHHFQKPNDFATLLFMNATMVTVVEDMADIVFAYGVSNKYRYPFPIFDLWDMSEKILLLGFRGCLPLQSFQFE